MLLYWFLLFGCLAPIAYGTQCVFETLKCAKLYRYFNVQSNFFETAAYLDRECQLQQRFFSCLNNISGDCYEDPYNMPIPEEFARMEHAFQRLCTEGADLRERYLKEAYCINRQATFYCTSEKYLGDDLELQISPLKRCMMTLRSRHCIDYLLKNNCGEDASYLFKELTFLLEDNDYCFAPEETEDSTEYHDSSLDPSRYGIYVEKELYEKEKLPEFPLGDIAHEIVKVNVDCSEDSSATDCLTAIYGKDASEYQTELNSDFAEPESEIFDRESSADRSLTSSEDTQHGVEFSSVNLEETGSTPKAEALFWASVAERPNMRFRG